MSTSHLEAAEALTMRLANRVCAPDTLLDQVVERAKLTASKAPLPVRALKAMVRGGAILPLDQAMSLERSEYNRLFATDTRREVVAALNEKRPPLSRVLTRPANLARAQVRRLQAVVGRCVSVLNQYAEQARSVEPAGGRVVVQSPPEIEGLRIDGVLAGAHGLSFRVG